METVTMTREEWIAKGTELFGSDMMKWKHVCPGCGHVQSVEDFRQFEDQGATPDSACRECIGRYSGGKRWSNGNLKETGGGPCDYAAYGLLCIAPVTVMNGETEHHVFAFAEGVGA